jgi:endonuclease YncB( thermonuclease family)
MFERFSNVCAIVVLVLFTSPLFAQESGKKRLVGKFRMVKVVDGDTLRVEIDGRLTSLRLLGIDTEECFHEDSRRIKEAKRDFEKYVKKSQKSAAHPSKYGTPFGEAAREFAVKFFKDVKEVEVENDDPNEKTGHFGRLLSYVFIVRDGKRVHYNAEAIRQGYSPYYVKYGRSRSYSKEFKIAEAEAKAAKRGIWGDWKAQFCYPDYETRLKWWGARADILDQWRNKVAENSKKAPTEQELLVSLNDAGGYAKLSSLVGKSVTVFGSIDRIRNFQGKGSTVVLSAKRDRMDILLGGRLQDTTKFIREFAILKGVVEMAGTRPIIRKGKLILPAIKTVPVNPNEKPKPSDKKIHQDNLVPAAKVLHPFHYSGIATNALVQLKKIFKVNLVIGNIPLADNKVINLSLRACTLVEALNAIVLAADLELHKVSRYVYVVKLGDKRKKLIAELETKLLKLLLRGPKLPTDSYRDGWEREITALTKGLAVFKANSAVLKKAKAQRKSKKSAKLEKKAG